MQDLTVTLIQTAPVWEDVDANLSLFSEKLSQIVEPTQLVVLPEMFSSGFVMDPSRLPKGIGNKSLDWMQREANDRGFAICGSTVFAEGERIFNRFFLVSPDGEFFSYDKRHLIGLTGEDRYYSAGTERIVFNYLGWRVLPQICYDLRFPCFSRSRDDYDLVLYVANWPEVRRSAWNTLLAARAIENQAYCVGLNRIGTDGNKLSYVGDSQVFDPLGEQLLNLADNELSISTTLSSVKLEEIRTSLPFLADRDDFTLRV